MSGSIWTILGVIIAFVVGLFFSRKSSQTDAEIAATNAKIEQDKEKLKDQKKDADAKTKEYLDALKDYDPDFSDDDDTGGHSA